MSNRTIRNVSKYVRYSLDRKTFTPDFGAQIHSQSLAAAREFRGKESQSSIIIHGILPRSGTVYVGELLRLHPDLYAYPNNLWEIPFLQHADRLRKLQEEFFWSHEQNMGKIGKDDFLPLFGSALIGYLRQYAPSSKRLLIKVPSVQYLSSFFDVFPFESLLAVIRDGRDVVHSTARTWPQIRFWMICLRWKRAAKMLMACRTVFEESQRDFWIGKFEDAVMSPELFVKAACKHYKLDATRYPFDRISDLPVRGASSLQAKGGISWYPMNAPADFRPMKYWQSWSVVRKLLFKSIAGKELIALGYAKDQSW